MRRALPRGDGARLSAPARRARARPRDRPRVARAGRAAARRARARCAPRGVARLRARHPRARGRSALDLRRDRALRARARLGRRGRAPACSRPGRGSSPAPSRRGASCWRSAGRSRPSRWPRSGPRSTTAALVRAHRLSVGDARLRAARERLAARARALWRRLRALVRERARRGRLLEWALRREPGRSGGAPRRASRRCSRSTLVGRSRARAGRAGRAAPPRRRAPGQHRPGREVVAGVGRADARDLRASHARGRGPRARRSWSGPRRRCRARRTATRARGAARRARARDRRRRSWSARSASACDGRRSSTPDLLRQRASCSTRTATRLDRYDKSHLVPFGEYVPFRALLGRVDPCGRDRRRGARRERGPGAARGATPSGARGEPDVHAGVPICYELLFPDLVRRFAGSGAQVLLAITNDAWYGRTGAPHQFLAITALRSAETGTWTARAANTGVSALIDARGHGAGADADLRARLCWWATCRCATPSRQPTFYARHGDVFAFACWAASARARRGGVGVRGGRERGHERADTASARRRRARRAPRARLRARFDEFRGRL